MLLHWCLYFQAVKNQSQTELVDEEAMSQIRKGHETMCVVLTSRHKNLDTVRAVWSTSDIKVGMWRYLRLMRVAAEQLLWLVWRQIPPLTQNGGSHSFCPQACTTGCHCVPPAVEWSQRNMEKTFWCESYLLFLSQLPIASALFLKSGTSY